MRIVLHTVLNPKGSGEHTGHRSVYYLAL